MSGSQNLGIHSLIMPSSMLLNRVISTVKKVKMFVIQALSGVFAERDKNIGEASENFL